MTLFASGDWAVLLLALTSLLLYALLGHRSWLLWGEARGMHDPASGLGVIRALIAALPLLGLLASVGGISETFRELAMNLVGTSARRAGGGIGQALTATQAGLVAALPAVVWERLLAMRAARLREQIAGAP